MGAESLAKARLRVVPGESIDTKEVTAELEAVS
jgi:hypothetical protein